MGRSMEIFRMKIYYAEAVCDGVLKTFRDTPMANILTPAVANQSNFVHNIRKKLAHIGVDPSTQFALTAIPYTPVDSEGRDTTIQTWLSSNPDAALIVSPVRQEDTLHHKLAALSRGGSWNPLQGLKGIASGRSSPRTGKTNNNSSNEQAAQKNGEHDESDLSRKVSELQAENMVLHQRVGLLTCDVKNKDDMIQILEKKISALTTVKELSAGQVERPRATMKVPCVNATGSRPASPACGKVTRMRHRPDQCMDVDRLLRELQERNLNLGIDMEQKSVQMAHLEEMGEIKDDTIRLLEKKLAELVKPTGSVSHFQPWDSNGGTLEKISTTATVKEVYRRMFLDALRKRVRSRLGRVFPSPPGTIDFLTVGWGDVLKLCMEVRDLQAKIGLDKVTLKVTGEDAERSHQGALHGNTGSHIGVYADVVLTQDPLHRPAYRKLFRFLYNQDAETVRNNLINCWT